MPNASEIWAMPEITVTFLPGSDICDAAANAIALAHRIQCRVRFKFNGADVRVRPWDRPDEIVNAYSEHCLKERNNAETDAAEA